MLSGIEMLLYGNPGASLEEAVKAAKKANAHNFIMELAQWTISKRLRKDGPP